MQSSEWVKVFALLSPYVEVDICGITYRLEPGSGCYFYCQPSLLSQQAIGRRISCQILPGATTLDKLQIQEDVTKILKYQDGAKHLLRYCCLCNISDNLLRTESLICFCETWFYVWIARQARQRQPQIVRKERVPTECIFFPIYLLTLLPTYLPIHLGSDRRWAMVK